MLKDILKKMKIKNPILLLLFIPLVSCVSKSDLKVDSTKSPSLRRALRVVPPGLEPGTK